ncbi:MAG TPA: hypothetical protein VK188_18630 [Holophaga sp.]|nr:hypothetical protein [Holophaga sp.]
MIKPLTRWYWARHARNNGLPEVRSRVEAFRASDPTGRRRELGRLLQAQLRLFSPLDGAYDEWRRLAREEDPECVLDAWSSLPIMTKKDQRERFPPQAIQAWLGGKGLLNSTGGSTGEPTFFVQDPGMVAGGLALQTLHWMRMGWKPGLPLVSLWGAQRDIGAGLKGLPALKKRLSDYLYGFDVIAGFSITEDTALRLLDRLEAGAPVGMYGYTSLLDFLARTAIKHGRTVRPGQVTTAWNGGECLFPDQSERFESVFHVPILNYYAGRELGPLAGQCRKGGVLEVPRPFVHLELVDAAGAPAAPGEEGRIIVTSTLCKGTPFLRYEVGDLGMAGPALRDEAGLLGLDAVSGRVSSLLTVGGKTISNIFWNHLFKEYPEIAQFQVVSRRDGLLFRFRGAGFSPEREASLRGILAGFLADVTLAIEWHERLPLTPAGKLIHVIQE